MKVLLIIGVYTSVISELTMHLVLLLHYIAITDSLSVLTNGLSLALHFSIYKTLKALHTSHSLNDDTASGTSGGSISFTRTLQNGHNGRASNPQPGL